jgi:hypothetical protein
MVVGAVGLQNEQLQRLLCAQQARAQAAGDAAADAQHTVTQVRH